MHQYHKTFFGESEDAVKTAPENSGLAKVQLSNLDNTSISQFFLAKGTMAVKTAPENSGLVRVQLPNLTNISISQDSFWWKWRWLYRLPHRTLVWSRFSDQISKIYQYHDDCKDCPRELWFGQGSVIKSHKYINITIFYLVKLTMTVKTAPENSGLVKVQLSNLTNISISQYSIWWNWRWL